MIIIKCDRCGEEKVVKNLTPFFGADPEQPTEIPKYSIMKTGDGFQTISLCKDCEAAFERWLKQGAEE